MAQQREDTRRSQLSCLAATCTTFTTNTNTTITTNTNTRYALWLLALVGRAALRPSGAPAAAAAAATFTEAVLLSAVGSVPPWSGPGAARRPAEPVPAAATPLATT
jgi:hypothetical protein